MNFEIDYISFVISKNPEFEKSSKKTPALPLVIFEILKTHPDEKSFGKWSKYKNEDIYLDNSSPVTVEMTLYGCFFLREDALKRLKILINFLNKTHHHKITRIDYQKTFEDGHSKNTSQLLFQKSISKLKLQTFSNQKFIETSMFYSSSFNLKLYNKTRQLSEMSKKKRFKEFYLPRFLKKYKPTLQSNLVRLEISIGRHPFLKKINEAAGQGKIYEFKLDDLKSFSKININKTFIKLLKTHLPL